MKLYLYLYLSLITLLLFCCKDKDNDNKAVLCENKYKLISADDTIPVFDINFKDKSESILDEIEKALETDICDKLVYFGIPFKLYDTDTISLKVRVYKECSKGAIPIQLRNGIFIMINKEGEYLINGKENDSISEYIQSNYLNYNRRLNFKNDPQSEFISLNWDRNINIDDLYKAIEAIIGGYLNKADVYVKLKYDVGLCELTKKQLETIKKKFPFNLQLGISSELPSTSPSLPPTSPSLRQK